MFAYPPVKYESDPFPHAVIRGAWDDDLLIACKQEFQEFKDWDGEKAFYGAQRKRYCGTFEKLPDCVTGVVMEASSPRFLTWLSELTGIEALIPDPYLHGGGMHSIRRGGFLKVHTDFNYHRRLDCYRRLNLLIYLNDWQDEWGGALELWDGECKKKVFPHRNTMAIFSTDDKSFHGHPHPLNCPESESRDSIALYYYTAKSFEGCEGVRLNTNYLRSDVG